MDLDLSCEQILICNWVFVWGPLKANLLELAPNLRAKLFVHLLVLSLTDFAAEVNSVASAANLTLQGKADLRSEKVNPEIFI